MKISRTTQTLLDIAGDIDYLLLKGHRSPGIGFSISQLRGIDEVKQRKLQRQTLERMKNRKLLEEIQEGNEIYFKLTDQGFAKLLKAHILFSDKELQSFEVCLVVFDVPENMKQVRNEIRSLLKRAGFYMVQRSVWESTRDVIFELEELITLLKVEKYVLVYRALRKLH